MQYQILSSNALSQLENLVNNELNHDWTPTGGLIAFSLPSKEILHEPHLFFAQAMIRHLPQNIPKH